MSPHAASPSEAHRHMVYITHIRLSGNGTRHEHITDATRPAGKPASPPGHTVVDWINNKNGGARVRDNADHDVRDGVVNANPPLHPNVRRWRLGRQPPRPPALLASDRH